jgi:predicted nucleotidyltransferase
MLKGLSSMRLSIKEVAIIKQVVTSLLGNDGVRVTLFGSRVDDDAKGGDIDLLVETTAKQVSRVSTANRIAASLQIQLGDQRIDVLLVDPNTIIKPIHEHARQQGTIL